MGLCRNPIIRCMYAYKDASRSNRHARCCIVDALSNPAVVEKWCYPYADLVLSYTLAELTCNGMLLRA